MRYIAILPSCVPEKAGVRQPRFISSSLWGTPKIAGVTVSENEMLLVILNPPALLALRATQRSKSSLS